MNVSFGTISVTQKARELIDKALDSKRVSCGEYVREFEKRFAALVGASEAVAVSSGTDADALALAVLYDFGAGRGDEVIVPALSFVGTGNAVLQAGFKPVFVDIELETLNINPHLIEAAIGPRTRAIMPVHLMGKPADMDAINSIAKKHGLYVIEDAAEAHGALYRGRKVGTLGDMAAYSLYVAHMISTIEGGIVVTGRDDFARVLRSLRAHGRACTCEKCVLNTDSGYCARRFAQGTDIRFVFERIGYSCKMNELEAAVGLGSLDDFDEILAKRRQNLLEMMKRFQKFSGFLTTIREEPHERMGPQGFPVILRRGCAFTRDGMVDYLEKSGIETRSLFSSMPTQCLGFVFLGYRLGQFPNAEYAGENGFHIGVHQALNQEHIDYFIETVEGFLRERTPQAAAWVRRG